VISHGCTSACLAHSTQKTAYPFLNQGFEFIQARQKTWSGLGVALCAIIQAWFKSGRFSGKCGMSKCIAGQTRLRMLIHCGCEPMHAITVMFKRSRQSDALGRFSPSLQECPCQVQAQSAVMLQIASPSRKPARLPHGAACARRATTSSSIFFDELVEQHDGAKRDVQVFWRSRWGSRRRGLNLTESETDSALT